MSDIILMTMVAIAVWMVSARVAAKSRYVEYLNTNSYKCSFGVFALMEDSLGKYRNGEFGG